MVTTVIILTLCILIGICSSVMDVLSFRYNTSFFKKYLGNYEQFFNVQISWLNKWKLDSNNQPIIVNGKYVERFLFSSTILVFLTDGWHLAKASMILFISLAISIPLIQLLGISYWYIIVSILLIYTIICVTFELFFTKVLIVK